MPMYYPVIDIHTHHANSGDIRIYAYLAGGATPLPTEDYSTGIHPWDAGKAAFSTQVEALLESVTPRTVAIGEIGLDYAVAGGHPDRAAQKGIFLAQLDVAKSLDLPVIIHCVRAYNELTTLLGGHPTPVIIHGFTGSPQLAAQLIRHGFYLSFGETLFGSSKTREALKTAPPDRIFLETDESAKSIADIYAEAAGLLEIQQLRLREWIYQNYKRVFQHG